MFLVYLVYGTMIVVAKVRIKHRIYKKNAPIECLELRNYTLFGIIFWHFCLKASYYFVPLCHNSE